MRKKYRVKMLGINWDDGKGEYDVSEAPRDLEITLNADNPADALEQALEAASDDYGSLIDDLDSYDVEPLD